MQDFDMPQITFDKAQKALGHLRSSNNGEKPPLLSVKGWDKSKKVYQLKNDLEVTFKAEIDRFRDLVQERQRLQQKLQQGEEIDIDRVADINDEIQELFQQEQEFDMSGEKLTEDEFGDVIDTETYIDLAFAIKNGKE